jgi:hypothetical protein
VCALGRTKEKAQRRALVVGDQRLGRAAHERTRARVRAVKGECVRVFPGRARDQPSGSAQWRRTWVCAHGQHSCARDGARENQSGTAGCSHVDEGCCNTLNSTI